MHLLGNLAAFAGKDTFNEYAYIMSRIPLLKLIELYLLIAFVGHAITGLLLSWRKRAFISKAPVERGMLLLTSLVTLVFIILHVLHFRLSGLSGSGTNILNGLAHVDGRDLFTMAQKLLGNPIMAVAYISGVLAVCWHLQLGWERVVKKIDLPMSTVPWALRFGKMAVSVLFWGFFAVVSFFYSGAATLAVLLMEIQQFLEGLFPVTLVTGNLLLINDNINNSGFNYFTELIVVLVVVSGTTGALVHRWLGKERFPVIIRPYGQGLLIVVFSFLFEPIFIILCCGFIF